MLGIFCDEKIVSELRGKTIVITGATGLIGKNLIRCLLEGNDECDLNIKIVAVIRNEKDARIMFGKRIQYIKCDFLQDKLIVDNDVDYIIHCASITESAKFVENPVETINTTICGINSVMELAREKSPKSVVYLSSMEVYGEKISGKISEDNLGYLDLLSPRSSYSESKRMAENICTAYKNEYDVPVKIARLAQTIGPGIKYDDKRVIVEFARCAIEGRDIVLSTQGLSEHMYIYVEDAVEAILTILIKGEVGKAYNVANDDTYCSIFQMAHMIREEIMENKIDVIVNENSVDSKKYAPEHHLYLDITELRKLGWEPRTSLKDSYINLINSLQG